jgi:predicted dehydrogenase
MSRWERFCVVGIGNHARTKLIPAIAANGQTLAALVSRQPASALPDAPLFATLDAALATLTRDTAIVIASPPAMHHAQVRAAIDAGFDVIVEKPAFVTAAQAQEVADLCTGSEAVLVEAFMQRHTGLYRRLVDFCAINPVAGLEIAFVIPAMPADTFRSDADLVASSLYDIGCYILALLDDLGLDVSPLSIGDVHAPGTIAEAVTLTGALDGVDVKAIIGVGPDYRNSVTVRLADGSETGFHPIFYGRPGSKTMGTQTIEDGNAFEAMFALPREQWLADQPARLDAMIGVTAQLERLAAQLQRFRETER